MVGLVVVMGAASGMYACRERPSSRSVESSSAPPPPTAVTTSTVPVQASQPISAVDEHTVETVTVPADSPAVPATPAGDATAPAVAAPAMTEHVPIQGVSHSPTTGKPVAAVSIEWNLQPDPAQLGRFTGTIGAINQAGPALVTLSVEALGDVVVQSVARMSAPAVGRGERVELPVLVHLQPGTAAAELLVTVRVEAASIRSRVVSIPIRRPAASPATEKSSATTTAEGSQGKPLHGEQTLTGSDGQAVHFMPAAGQK